MISVLLVDYPIAVRRALRARLSLERDLAIVGEADDAQQGMSMASELEPDVMLLDAETPDLDVALLVRAVTDGDRCPAVVVLSQHTAELRSALSGTPASVVGKHEGLASLVGAIRSAAGRFRWP